MEDIELLEHGIVLLGILALCFVHWCLYRGAKRLLSACIDDFESVRIFMTAPLPWWLHVAVFHFSFLFTAVLIWLMNLFS